MNNNIKLVTINLYICLKFSLVICFQFIVSKYIHRLSMARSQKQSPSKQREDFDNLKWKNGPKAFFYTKNHTYSCVHTEAVFDACIIQTVKNITKYYKYLSYSNTQIPFSSISLALSIFLPFTFSASAGLIPAFFFFLWSILEFFIAKAGPIFFPKIFPPPPPHKKQMVAP